MHGGIRIYAVAALLGLSPACTGQVAVEDDDAEGDGGGPGGGPDGGPGECSGDDCVASCQASELVVAETGSTNAASLIATDGGYAVSWTDRREGHEGVYLARIGLDGAMLGSPVPLITEADAMPDGKVALAAADDGYGIAYPHTPSGGTTGLYFLPLDAAGQPIGSPVWVADAPHARALTLAWNGDGFGLTWSMSVPGGPTPPTTRDLRPHFVRLAPDGARRGEATEITVVSGFAYEAAMVWSGAAYDLIVQGRNDNLDALYFARIDAAGRQLADAHFVIPGDFEWTGEPSTTIREPVITWSGDGFGVSWLGKTIEDDRYVTFLTQLDRNGAKVGEHALIGPAYFAHRAPIAWTGAGYAVLLGEGPTYASDTDVDGTLTDVLVSPGGEVMSAAPVTAQWNWEDDPARVATGAGAALLFVQASDGDPEGREYVLRTSCP